MAINQDGTATRGPNGWTVEDAITQNYLTRRNNRGGEEAETTERITLDPADPEGSARAQGIDLRAALKDVAPNYNPGDGPIKLDAIVPDNAFRAPAKDEGIGGILAIATAVAGFTLGIPAPITAAFKFALSGGENILGSITSAFLPGVSSFLGDAAGAASDFGEVFSGVGDAVDSIDAGFEAVTQAPSIADTAAEAANISVDPAKTLLADSGQTASDASRFSDPTPAVPDAERWESGAKLDMTNANPESYANQATGESWIDKLLKDPKSTGGLISGALTVGGSMLSGAANRDAAKEISDRNANTAMALEDKRAANAQELARQQVTNAEQLEAWRRQFAQSGNFFGATPAVSAGNTVLRRPDGTPVYQNGIIASRMT